jgi:hypothetical protein
MSRSCVSIHVERVNYHPGMVQVLAYTYSSAFLVETRIYTVRATVICQLNLKMHVPSLWNERFSETDRALVEPAFSVDYDSDLFAKEGI